MSDHDTLDALAGRSLLLVGGGALAGAVAEAALARGMRLVMLLADDDDSRRSAARFAARALTLFDSIDDQGTLAAAVATAASPSGLDAVIEIAFAADSGEALLATHPGSLTHALDTLIPTLRLAQAVMPALRANAGTLVCALTPAALGDAFECGGAHAVTQRARAALIERLATETSGGAAVYGLCVPPPPRLAPPPRDITATVFQPEPSTWADEFLRLLDPTRSRPRSGRIVTAGPTATIEGLVILAGE